jgi:hypothetical protein
MTSRVPTWHVATPSTNPSSASTNSSSISRTKAFSTLLEVAGSEALGKFAAEMSRPTGEIEAVGRYQFVNSFLRLYELYFNLSQQGLLDKSIGESYEKVIRLFVMSELFSDWWEQAREIEYQGAFSAHIDAVAAEMKGDSQRGAAAADSSDGGIRT